MYKNSLKKRLENEVPELKKLGWSDNEINTLLKHFTYYLSLVNEEKKPTNNKQKNFLSKVKNWKSAVPENIHEQVYFKYMKFFFDKNTKKKRNNDEDEIWKNIPKDQPGAMQYSQEMVDKLNTQYEPVSMDDWYDDLKHR